MRIKKAFKFRIYPNSTQQAALAVQFGHARFVYNWSLARRKEVYKETGQGLNGFALNKELTTLKKEPDFEWLQEADSQVLQQKTKDLDCAYKNFFEKRAKFPKFKKKTNSQSIRYPQRFKVDGSRIYLPKVGRVRAIFHRPLEGMMKNCTVTKTTSSKYFISIQCEVEIEEPTFAGGQVGIDLGIKDFAALSTGEKIANPKHLRKSEKRLARLQRRLSRKVKRSANRGKQRVKVARLQEKIANQRRDFQHKLSYRLVAENRLIALENLNVAGMVKNHCLAKSISDAGWSEFVRQIEYKGDWYGCQFEKVNRFFASSKTCSACGAVNHRLKLSDRTWICMDCGTVHDRDHNAATNILNKTTAGNAESNACGDRVNPCSGFNQVVVDEAGSPRL